MVDLVAKFTHESQDFYLMWSTGLDAPVTDGMSLDELKDHYREEYGNVGAGHLPRILKLVEQNGIASRLKNLEGYLEINRAGKNESHLTKEQIIRKYCLLEEVDF